METIQEKIKLPESVKRLEDFISSKTLDAALGIAWDDTKQYEDYYCHYTTLPNLLCTILKGEWYLNGSLSQRFDDLQEVEKFGDKKLARKSYQLSFGKSVRESAAFWGLYGRNNPFAVKVLLPGQAIADWITLLRAQKYDATFKDVIYASIPLKRQSDNPDPYDKKRGMTITWNNVTCNFGWDKEERSSLPERLRDEDYTGWFKDHEWAFENESRLIVRLRSGKAKSIVVPYPATFLGKMSFTFSPWLKEYDDVKRIITDALKFAQKSRSEPVGVEGKRFHRSVLDGALKFDDEQIVECPGTERCRFGMLVKTKETVI